MESNFDLEEFGWNAFFSDHFAQLNRRDLALARVIEEFKGFYKVRTGQEEYLAEIGGKIRQQATQRKDFPAVGDWVAILTRPDEARARIEFVLPRKTELSRKAAGRELNEQMIAVNLDTVFVVSSLYREFNLRRIERYLSMVWDSGARPVILLNKADLCADPDARAAEVESIAPGTPVHLLSALEKSGLEIVRSYLVRGTTAAFVGSSGVGKTTIINALAGTALGTRAVRAHDGRGQHTTTSRQMIFLAGGGVVIDTPGMRELQLWNNEEGVGRAFEDIAALAKDCKFRDCAHHGEPECAIEQAVNRGGLPLERLESYRKLLAELRFQERKMNPEAARQEKAKWKKVHKAMRHRPEET